MKNLFADIPASLETEIIERLVTTDVVTIERIVSMGHTSPADGWYDQQHNEWLLVLSGAAVLAFEDGTEISMKPGDTLDIPAHKKHRVKWTSADTETVWLAVHYAATATR